MKTTTKLFITLVIAISSIQIPISANAATPASTTTVEYQDGYYIETVISDEQQTFSFNNLSTQAMSTTTKTKTATVKDANGNALWQVSITATFRYDGSSATCTNCSHSTSVFSSKWRIQSSSSNRSGNSATATATAVETGLGGISHSFTRSVTIECNALGTIS